LVVVGQAVAATDRVEGRDAGSGKVRALPRLVAGADRLGAEVVGITLAGGQAGNPIVVLWVAWTGENRRSEQGGQGQRGKDEYPPRMEFHEVLPPDVRVLLVSAVLLPTLSIVDLGAGSAPSQRVA